MCLKTFISCFTSIAKLCIHNSPDVKQIRIMIRKKRMFYNLTYSHFCLNCKTLYLANLHIFPEPATNANTTVALGSLFLQDWSHNCNSGIRNGFFFMTLDRYHIACTSHAHKN